MEAVKANVVLPISNWHEVDVTVFGMGRSGRAAADLLLDLGAQVTIVEEQTVPELEATAVGYEQRGARIFLGSQFKKGLRDADIVVVSPGVSKDHPAIKQVRQRDVPVIGEIELAGWLLQAPIIAVTGTNGKSTTVQLIGAILQQSGKQVFVGGNLGIPLCEAVFRPPVTSDRLDYEYIVAEVSSFQLETIKRFRPWIAVLLNVTPDHLDRHPTQEEYRATKQRIFENQTPEDWALINADDPVVRSMRSHLKAPVCEFSLCQKIGQGVFLEGNIIQARIQGREWTVAQRDEIPMRGDHNLANAMAATNVGLLCGCSIEDIMRAFQRTPTFEHTLEFVREWNGITFINDSKGTNVDATLKALQSFKDPVVLILGGKDKGGDFSLLADPIRRQVQGLVVMGEAAPRILKALGQTTSVTVGENLTDAVSRAVSLASKGNVVLFSPACASFDMFRNYHHRGLEFKRIVGELQ